MTCRRHYYSHKSTIKCNPPTKCARQSKLMVVQYWLCNLAFKLMAA